MKCSRCQIEFNAGHWGECPHCGDRRDDGLEGVVKTSAILISTDDGGIFRSIEDVPEPLRQQLVATTSSIDSATIVIADKGGRARIAAALRNLPKVSAGKNAIIPFPPRPAAPAPVPVFWWAGLLAALSAAGLTWLVCSRLL